MTTTLLVLAATMGNRYGGLKTPECIGPNGETVLDYSIYDAVQAGFNKVIFVISRFFEDEFKEKIASKYVGMVDVEYVYQDVDLVPAEKRNPKRTHLWGSAQAVLMGEGVIDEPFGVINAVNFYQRESFELLYTHLQHLRAEENRHILISYRLGNVVPESGGANRGICEVDDDGMLVSVTDRPGVERISGYPMYLDELNKWIQLDENAPVSMNMWAFTPDVLDKLEKRFMRFLENGGLNSTVSEFLIPIEVDGMLREDGVKVKVIPTPGNWYGMTFAEDMPIVQKALAEMTEQGLYPAPLFGE
jgi:NDP-sugar pyrophosphorylase family protein